MGPAHWLVFQRAALAVISNGLATFDLALARPRHCVGAQLAHISVVMAGPLSFVSVSLAMASVRWYGALVSAGTAIHVATISGAVAVGRAAVIAVFPSMGSARPCLSGLSSSYHNGNGHPQEAR